jgi:hypothetical protein
MLDPHLLPTQLFSFSAPFTLDAQSLQPVLSKYAYLFAGEFGVNTGYTPARTGLMLDGNHSVIFLLMLASLST